jgi:hypothetical protein
MNYLIKLNLSITIVLATINLSYAGECSQLDGLPDLDLPFGITKFFKKKKKNEDNSSCKMIDNDPLYQDPSLQENFCKEGCTAQISDAQKKVYMSEMKNPDAKRWHSNWHTISNIYSDAYIGKIRDLINKKKNTTETNTSEMPFSLEDLTNFTEKEVLDTIQKSRGKITEWLKSGDIPSQCHETISAEERKPIIPTNQLAEITYNKSYEDCIEGVEKEDPITKQKTREGGSWFDDLKKFIVKNQNVGGENFLYMHHSMRNQVQMMLSNAGLPCIAGWSNIPGPDGVTGYKEGRWKEIWTTNANNRLFTESEQNEMKKNGFTKKEKYEEKEKEEYLNWKAGKITEDILDKKKNSSISLKEMTRIIKSNGINVMGKIFENDNFLASISMNELGKLMSGTIHDEMHMSFNQDKSGCQYQDGNKTVDVSIEGCDLASTTGSHIHATFWKLHGWCDDVIKKWMNAGGREYSQIGTTDSCKETSCYKVNGTWSGAMPQF